MTEKLRALMHAKADEVSFATPDLDLLIRHGERRLRLRRGAIALAGVAAASVIGVGALAAFGGPSAQRPGDEVAAPSVETMAPTYAEGSVIHNGQETIEVGVRIRTFVRTAVGYVVVDTSGSVLSVVGGSVTEVGRMDPERIRVVSDPDGSLAGWVQSDGDRPAFVVLDQAEGTVQVNDEATTPGQGLRADELRPAYFCAVDDGTAYWLDSRGAVAVDVATGETDVVQSDARTGFDVLDAESGQIAFGGGMPKIAIGTTSTDIDQRLTLQQSGGSFGTFSPDGAHLALDADSPEVFDVSRGTLVDFSGVPEFFANGYEWLDADTLVMMSLESEESPIDVLTCSVSAGTCEVALDDLGSIEDYESGRLVLPIGATLD